MGITFDHRILILIPNTEAGKKLSHIVSYRLLIFVPNYNFSYVCKYSTEGYAASANISSTFS